MQNSLYICNRLARDNIMKVKSSIKSARARDKDCYVVRRNGKTYVLNKKNPRYKVRQG